jgi:restriction system protein
MKPDDGPSPLGGPVRSRALFLSRLTAVAAGATSLAAVGGGGGGDGGHLTSTPLPLRVDEAARVAAQLERAAAVLASLPFALPSVVDVVGTVPDGALIEVVGPAMRRIIELLHEDPGALQRLDWRTVEEVVAAAYKADGFDEVILTPRSGDLGRDLIATKYGRHSIRILGQVKHFSPGHRVTAEEVRAMGMPLIGDRAASKAVVATTSTFAPGIERDALIQPLMPTRLELIGGLDLTQWLLGLKLSGA